MAKYDVYVTANDYIEVEADCYEGGGDGYLLRFVKDDKVVAKFKQWVAVITNNG